MYYPTTDDKRMTTETNKCKMISEWPLITDGTSMLCNLINRQDTESLDEVR